jgi:hypothetical protein
VIEARLYQFHSEPEIVAAQTLEFSGDTIKFFKCRKRLAFTAFGGMLDLDFVPSHAIKIRNSSGISQGTFPETSFGLREDGAILRKHCEQVIGGLVSLVRELEDKEIEAIVNYGSAPHLNTTSRAVAMRFTEAELEEVKAKSKGLLVNKFHYYTQEQDINRATHSGWE